MPAAAPPPIPSRHAHAAKKYAKKQGNNPCCKYGTSTAESPASAPPKRNTSPKVSSRLGTGMRLLSQRKIIPLCASKESPTTKALSTAAMAK